MSTNVIYAIGIGTFSPVLRSLSALLDKGAAHARDGKRDPDSLVALRLAPDMFPLAQQVQIACDMAKNGIVTLAGQSPSRFEDNEKTIAELKDRIARTIALLDTFPASAFDGAAEREIKYPLLEGRYLQMTGLEFLRDWTLPHFYFHVVTAYDILRHDGVAIGKLDFMTHVGYAIRQAA